MRLGALLGQLQARLDGFKSRALRTKAPVQRHIYLTEWRAIDAAKSQSDSMLVIGNADLCAREHLPKAHCWHYEVVWTCVANYASPPLYQFELLVIGNGLVGPLSRSGHGVTYDHNIHDDVVETRSSDAVLFTAPLLLKAAGARAELLIVNAGLHLLQGLSAHSDAPPIWLCTMTTQPISSSSQPSHAGLWGFTRACRHELKALPAWCLDVHPPGIRRIAAVVLQHMLCLPRGGVRGLQVSSTSEPEAACGSSLHVPRLVALSNVQPIKLDIKSMFEAMCCMLDKHALHSMVALNMDETEQVRTLSAYYLLEAVCQQYASDALHTCPAAMVSLWHQKLLHAWCAKQSLKGFSRAILPSDIKDLHFDLWAEMQLIERCGPRMADVLSGVISHQELLFPDGSMEVMRAVYEDAVGAAFYNRCIIAVVEALAAHLPSYHRMVVLEIGAGTGSTASSILVALDGACERYIFTDVSEVFLRQARMRFAEFSFLEYALLNVDADPCLQGFVIHRHDVIVAANVLHATPFVHTTLRNCELLLCRGGVLIVNELFQSTAFLQITFGLTDGWWLFSESCDPERMGQDGPLLSWRQWQALLTHSSFSDCRCMQGHAFLRSQAVIVAQAPSTACMHTALAYGAHMVSGGLGGLGLLTARLLVEVGARQIVLTSRSDHVMSSSEMDWAWIVNSGADVQRVRCDASDDGAVRTAVLELYGHKMRLCGIFHAAHHLADALLTKQHAINFAATYGPKVHGAHLLHAASSQATLSCFHMSSSAAGLMGNAGQAPHSAANTQLDAIAVYRRGGGVHGQTVSWGAVAEIGYAAHIGADRRAEDSGSGAVSRLVAMDALRCMLLPASLSFAVLPIDWQKLIRGGRDMRGMLAPYAHLGGHVPTGASEVTRLSTRLAAGIGLEAVLHVVRHVAGGLDDADTPLMEAGVDSLGAVELRNRLQHAVGEHIALSSTLMFDHPTARQLALHVHGIAPVS